MASALPAHSEYLGDGKFRQTIVTKERNAYGWRWNMQGVDLSRYQLNPAVLWNHQDAVIGRTTRMLKSSDRLIAEYEYLPGDELAERIKNADQQHFLPSASIGALPLEVVEEGNGNLYFPKWQLFEWSKTPIGADMFAIQE